jgi:hypothetical protein
VGSDHTRVGLAKPEHGDAADMEQLGHADRSEHTRTLCQSTTVPGARCGRRLKSPVRDRARGRRYATVPSQAVLVFAILAAAHGSVIKIVGGVIVIIAARGAWLYERRRRQRD